MATDPLTPPTMSLQDMMAWYGQSSGVDPSLYMDPKKRMQMQMGQSMVQGGLDTSPLRSPFQGLAKVAGVLLGKNMMSDAFGGGTQADPAAAGNQQKLFDSFRKQLPPDQQTQWDYMSTPQRVSTLAHVTTEQMKDAVSTGGITAQKGGYATEAAQKAMAYYNNLPPEQKTPQQWYALSQSFPRSWQFGFDTNGNVFGGPVPGMENDPRYKYDASQAEAGGKVGPAVAQASQTPIVVGNQILTPAGAGVGGGGYPAPPSASPVGSAAAPAGGASPAGAPLGPAATGPASAATPAMPGATPLPASPAAAGTLPPPAPPAQAAAPGAAPATTPPAPAAATTPGAPPPVSSPPPLAVDKNIAPLLPPPAAATPAAGAQMPALLAGVLAAERTPAGAVGKAGETTAYQVTSGAAKDVGMAPAKTEAEGREVAQRYLAKQMATFKDPRKAFIAYNMGPGATANWLNRTGGDESRLPPAVRAYADRGMAGYAAAQQGVAPGAAPTAPAAAPQGPAPTAPPIPQAPPEDLGQPQPPPPDFLVGAMSGGPGGGVPSPLPLRPGSEGPALPPGGAQAGGPDAAGAGGITAPATVAPATPAAAAATPPAKSAEGFSRNFDPTSPLRDAGPNYGPSNPYHGAGDVTRTQAGAMLGADPSVKPIVDEAQKTYETNTAKYQAAQNAFQHLDVMQHDLDELNKDPNAPNTGRTLELRQQVAGIWNDIAHKIDPSGTILKGFDANALASAESFAKESNNMAQQVGGAIHATDNTIEGAYHGVPNGALSDRGNRFVMQVLKETYNRDRDLHLFQNAWMTDPSNPGHVLVGSEEAFNKAHPIGDYMKQAYYNVVDPRYIERVQGWGDKPPPGAEENFDRLWGKGMFKFTQWQLAQQVRPGDR